jgi:DNA-binding IclR family transcriptional regulator
LLPSFTQPIPSSEIDSQIDYGGGVWQPIEIGREEGKNQVEVVASRSMKTKQTKGRGERAAQNRSLERGIEILRAFRQGVDMLGNGELAERTGLSKATVSRLTQTLVAGGMLEHVRSERAYRLGAPVLALAHAMRIGSPILSIAGPKMRSVAEKQRVNVGLAAPDRDSMVYLESFRYNRRASLRSVVAGQRVPIELTSLGRAYLASLTEEARRQKLLQLKPIRPQSWNSVEREIETAVASVEKTGFCLAAWQPGVVAVAAPLVLGREQTYALNISITSDRPPAHVARELKVPLLELKAALLDALTEGGCVA